MKDENVNYVNMLGEDVDPTSTIITNPWWTVEDSQRGTAIFHQLRHLRETQRDIEDRQNLHGRLYSPQFTREIAPYSDFNNYRENQSKLTINLINVICDTWQAKLIKNKPRPLFLTTRGNYDQQKQAQQLSQFVLGHFRAERVYEKGQHMGLQAAVLGNGAIQVIPNPDKKTVEYKVIPFNELHVDQMDARYQSPKTLYRTRWVDRRMLMAKYPEQAEKIKGIPFTQNTAPDFKQAGYSMTRAADMLEVIEAWRLPDIKGENGHHSISVAQVSLVQEEWSHNHFGMAFFTPTPSLTGFYGISIPEKLIGIQFRLNKHLQDVDDALHLVAKPRLFIGQGATVPRSHIDSRIGTMVRMTSGSVNDLKFVTPQGLNAETYNHITRLYNWGFQITGVNEMSATGKKPGGLDSGAALREYNDQNTERFALVAQRLETFYMDLAKLTVWGAKTLDEDHGINMVVAAKEKNKALDIKWKDVKLKEDQYVIDVFPASMLPTEPAGKIQRVVELLQANLIPKDLALTLLDFPDIDAAIGVETASLKEIQYSLDQMISEGNPMSPTEYTNLQLARDMAHKKYLELVPQDLPPERMELLRNYIKTADMLLKKSQEAAQMAAPMPQAPQGQAGALPAQAAPPPVSEMLPQG